MNKFEIVYIVFNFLKVFCFWGTYLVFFGFFPFWSRRGFVFLSLLNWASMHPVGAESMGGCPSTGILHDSSSTGRFPWLSVDWIWGCCCFFSSGFQNFKAFSSVFLFVIILETRKEFWVDHFIFEETPIKHPEQKN